MVRDLEDTQALLDDSREALAVLQRLVGKLEAQTERLEDELTRHAQEGGDPDAQ